MKNKINILILTAITFLLSGCYYTRVLKVKGQMKSFNRYFILSNNNNFTMRFKEPVLLEKDIEKIMNSKAIYEEETTNGKKLHYEFIKELENKEPDEKIYDIPIYFEFEDGKLIKYVSNKKFPKIFSKNFLTETFTELGESKVDRKKFSVEINLEKRVEKLKEENLPSYYDFLGFLGRPSLYENTDNYKMIRYHYKLAGKDKSKLKMVIDVFFYKENQKFYKLKFRLDGFKIF